MKTSLYVSILALVFAASPATSQTVYKSTMPDGKVVYSEKPVTGAKSVDKIDPPPPKTGMTTITPQEKARAEQLAKPGMTGGQPADPNRARADARKALEDAEAAREAGKEPLPGERLGLKGGGSRLTEEYQARQKQLDDAVEAAKKRVADTK